MRDDGCIYNQGTLLGTAAVAEETANGLGGQPGRGTRHMSKVERRRKEDRTMDKDLGKFRIQ